MQSHNKWLVLLCLTVVLTACTKKFTNVDDLMALRFKVLDEYMCDEIKREAHDVLREPNAVKYESPTYLSDWFTDLGKNARSQWTQNFRQWLPEDTPKNYLNDFSTIKSVELPRIEELSCKEALETYYENLDYRKSNGPVPPTFIDKIKVYMSIY